MTCFQGLITPSTDHKSSCGRRFQGVGKIEISSTLSRLSNVFVEPFAMHTLLI